MNLFPSLGTATGELAVGVGLTIVLTSVTLAAIRLKSAKVHGRCNLIVVGALLFIALFAVVGRRYDVPGYDVIISAILWSGSWLYVLGTVLWLGLKILALVRYTEPSADDGHDTIADISKLRGAIGWEPPISLEEGVEHIWSQREVPQP